MFTSIHLHYDQLSCKKVLKKVRRKIYVFSLDPYIVGVVNNRKSGHIMPIEFFHIRYMAGIFLALNFYHYLRLKYNYSILSQYIRSNYLDWSVHKRYILLLRIVPSNVVFRDNNSKARGTDVKKLSVVML